MVNGDSCGNDNILKENAPAFNKDRELSQQVTLALFCSYTVTEDEANSNQSTQHGWTGLLTTSGVTKFSFSAVLCFKIYRVDGFHYKMTLDI